MKDDKQKPWGFCVTKDSTCTMNYCDENGCQDRVRVPVEPVTNESETIKEQFEDIYSLSIRRGEDSSVVWDWLQKQLRDYKIAQDGNLRKLDELNEWKRSAMEVHKPLYDYIQGPAGTALGLKIGDSIIEKTVELLKEIENSGSIKSRLKKQFEHEDRFFPGTIKYIHKLIDEA